MIILKFKNENEHNEFIVKSLSDKIKKEHIEIAISSITSSLFEFSYDVGRKGYLQCEECERYYNYFSDIGNSFEYWKTKDKLELLKNVFNTVFGEDKILITEYYGEVKTITI